MFFKNKDLKSAHIYDQNIQIHILLLQKRLHGQHDPFRGSCLPDDPGCDMVLNRQL